MSALILFYDKDDPLVGDVFSPNAAHSETRPPESRASVPSELKFNRTGRETTMTWRKKCYQACCRNATGSSKTICYVRWSLRLSGKPLPHSDGSDLDLVLLGVFCGSKASSEP